MNQEQKEKPFRILGMPIEEGIKTQKVFAACFIGTSDQKTTEFARHLVTEDGLHLYLATVKNKLTAVVPLGSPSRRVSPDDMPGLEPEDQKISKQWVVQNWVTPIMDGHLAKGYKVKGAVDVLSREILDNPKSRALVIGPPSNASEAEKTDRQNYVQENLQRYIGATVEIVPLPERSTDQGMDQLMAALLGEGGKHTYSDEDTEDHETIEEAEDEAEAEEADDDETADREGGLPFGL